MKYNELELTAKKQKTRVGRGIAAGKGKTAGRGTKGQNARKSGGVRPGFEGGQNPLMQRLPKLRCFRSIAVPTENVYTSQLNDFSGNVDAFKLFEAGIIKNPYNRVKVIVNGELTKKVTVSAQGASKDAIAMIKKAGGEFKQVERAKHVTKTKTDTGEPKPTRKAAKKTAKPAK